MLRSTEKIQRLIQAFYDWVDDPENPQNWSMPKKLHVTFCICLITIAVYMGSSIVTPGIMGIMTDLKVAQVPATLSLSLFVAGYG